MPEWRLRIRWRVAMIFKVERCIEESMHRVSDDFVVIRRD